MALLSARWGKSWVVSLVTVVAFVAAQVPLPAFAQNAAQAEVMFKEGKDLMGAGNYAAACQRLTASFKLDPQPNVELVQGVCFGKLGKTASAYNAFLDASNNLPKGDPAQKYAADQAKALETQLLKVKMEMQPTVPQGVAIRFDDETKTRDKDFVDIDIALDPGDHDVYVTAPGKQDYTKHFTLKAGETAPHVIIVNMIDKTKEELANENNKGGGQVIVEKPETSWSTVKTLGMVGIIVGGVAVLAAGGLQVLALTQHANATTEQKDSTFCPSLTTLPNNPDTACQDAVNYQNTAYAAQGAAIGVGIAGGVILIAGIVMFVVGGNVTKTVEKPAPAASWQLIPMVSPHLAGVGLTGTF
jgi:hypothetical protein